MVKGNSGGSLNNTTTSNNGGGGVGKSISKTAYQLSKSLAADAEYSAKSHGFDSTSNPFNSTMGTTGGLGYDTQSMDGSMNITAAMREKMLEDEVMGNIGEQGQGKSHGMEKNLEQMVKVLNSRLKSLENAAKMRMKLCEEDLNALSSKTSKDAPKIVDDFSEEAIPKSIREMKRSDFATATNSNTLASNVNGTSNTINNATTSTVGHAKDNLVSSDSVYIDPYHLVVKTKAPTETAKKLESHLEEMHGTSNLRDMKNKKNKALNQNDKSKVTEQRKNEAKKIIRQKIEKKLQTTMENFVTRSVMDPELIFQVPDTVNIEAIWPVSVKWSSRDPRSALPENADGEFDPDLLLRYGMERMNLPSGRKLFVWLIKQTMIQRYFVALFWLIKLKFFEGEDIGKQEAYLMRLISIEYRTMIELLGTRAHAEHEKDFVFKYLPFIFTNAAYFGFYYVFPGSRHIYTKSFKKTIYMQVIQIMHGFQVCAISVKVIWSKVFPEDTHDDDEGEDTELFPVQLALKKPPPPPVVLSRPASRRTISPLNGTRKSGQLATSDQEDEEDEEEDEEDEEEEASSLGGGSSAMKSRGTLNGGGNPDDATHHSHQTHSTGIESAKSASSFFPGASKQGYIKSQDTMKPAELLQDPLVYNPLTRTYLKAPIEKPAYVRSKIKRQNQIDRVNADEVSPQMAFFLSSMKSSTSESNIASQSFRRTIPVNWCPAGGSDTHQRLTIHTALHDEIGSKLKASQEEFAQETRKWHHKKLEGNQEVKDTLAKVLSSGPTNISRFSLDLIRRQRMIRGKEVGANVPTEGLKPDEELDLDALNQLAAREIDIEEVLRDC